MNKTSIVLLLLLPLLIGCGSREQGRTSGAVASANGPVFAELYLTEGSEADDVDAPAVWQGADGETWVISACRSTDRLLVHDAATGALLRQIGVSGSGPGQFERPNGVAIVDDLAIVVERDNHRLQVFRLPAWTVLGSFGADELVKPYGIAVRRDSSAYLLYVTDNYETPEETVPPDAELGRRVKVFRMTAAEKTVTGELLTAFGETEGDGILHVVESIAIDTARNRLLIADEDGAVNEVKVYDLDGRFTGAVMGSGVFRYQPEGIVLAGCPDGSGYYICVDQDMTDNRFHVFDRKTLKHVTSFRGNAVVNSDGIALTQLPVGPHAGGLLFAVHNNGAIGAFDWRTIAEGLRLKHRCPEPAIPDTAE